MIFSYDSLFSAKYYQTEAMQHTSPTPLLHSRVKQTTTFHYPQLTTLLKITQIIRNAHQSVT